MDMKSPFTELQVDNILALTDFSACSLKALRYATRIACRHHSRLTILHIVPPRFSLVARGAEVRSLRDAWAEMKGLQSSLLASGELRAVNHQLLVSRGKYWKVISRILASQSTDLIVIGTRGRTGLEKLILGSFAEEVFEKAPCPVLTVGPEVPEQAIAESPRHILFPADGTYAWKAAEPYAFQLGRDAGAQLTLLGVLQTGLFANSKSGAGDRLRRTRTHLEATGLYAAWREGGVTPNVMAEVGSTVETVLGAAKAKNSDLIILGISKDENLQSFGPADAYRIICSAECPVLTVRDTFPDPYFKRLLQMEPMRGAPKNNSRNLSRGGAPGADQTQSTGLGDARQAAAPAIGHSGAAHATGLEAASTTSNL